MKRAKRHLFPLLLTVSAFFLFNPNINILDVFPDCIAYFFMILAIRRLSDLVPHFAEAKTALARLFWLSLLRIPAFLITVNLLAGNGQERPLYTTVALAFGVLELSFLIPAIREFFAGMDYLGERFGLASPIGPAASRAQRASYIALGAKPFLALIPELSLLYFSDYITSTVTDPAIFRPHLTALCCLVGLGFGIYFLIAFLPFCRALRRDAAIEPLLAAVRAEQAAPLRGHDRILRIRFAMGCLVAGAACMLDIYFDDINYLPSLLGFAAFLAMAVALYPLCKAAIPVGIFSVLGAIVSALSYILRARFFVEYGYHSLDRSREADALYARYMLSAGGESVLLFGTVLCVCVLLFAVIRNHTGYRADNVNNYSSHLSLHAALRRMTVIWTILGGLMAAASAANVILRQFTERVELNPAYADGSTVLPLFGWFWMVPCVVCLIWMAYSFYLGDAIHTETLQKYRLEG